MRPWLALTALSLRRSSRPITPCTEWRGQPTHWSEHGAHA
jgi:hypothetical protein